MRTFSLTSSCPLGFKHSKYSFSDSDNESDIFEATSTYPSR